MIRGDLAALRATAGDFSQATTDCLFDDLTGTSLFDSEPPGPNGLWYLVRELTPRDTGSYESGGTRQLGLRDWEIAAAAASCP